MQSPTLSRRLVAEFLGTTLLLVAVVGSGIMAERLAGGNVAIALLANTIAIGSALVFLIIMLGPISGAHMNPAVSLSATLLGDLPKLDGAVYALVQVVGGLTGVVLANLMFDLPAIAASTKARTGIGIWIGELIATFGLIGVVITVGRRGNVGQTAAAVAAYISAGIWFTSSTSFANPAVTIARTMTDSFTGIRSADAPIFIILQLVGAVAGTTVFEWLSPEKKS
jgi:glycerol uptake facilitator-like aquaporin